jgi:hypothetical protein
MFDEIPVVPIGIGKVAFAVKRKNVNNEKCFRYSHFTPDGYPDILHFTYYKLHFTFYILHFTYYILHITYYILHIAYCKLQIANCKLPIQKSLHLHNSDRLCVSSGYGSDIVYAGSKIFYGDALIL